MADFDPYYQWLAIPPKDQPPTITGSWESNFRAL